MCLETYQEGIKRARNAFKVFFVVVDGYYEITYKLRNRKRGIDYILLIVNQGLKLCREIILI